MATASELFNMNQKHLIGKFVFANVPSGNIKEIKMPKDSQIVTVSAADFQYRKVKVLDSFFPILAGNKIDYPGQPVIAVIGSDIEKVEHFISCVEIITDSEDNSNEDLEEVKPFEYTSGDFSKFFHTNANVFSSEYCVSKYESAIMSDIKVQAVTVEDKVLIQTPTQWPVHVKNTTASLLQIPEENVRIYPVTFHANNDQLVIIPSLVAPVAAMASKKTKMLVEMQLTAQSSQPGMKFTIKSEFDYKNDLAAISAEVDLDLGAYALFTNEICNSIVAGLVPSYNCNAAKIKINCRTSHSKPANFFGDLGHSMAVAAFEHHINFVMNKKHSMPSQWRITNLNTLNPESLRIKTPGDSKSLKFTLEEISSDSNFERNHVVFVQNSVKNRLGRGIISYSRGLGLACAQGIHGFSNRFPYTSQYFVKLTMNSEQSVIVSIGFIIDKRLKKVIREIISANTGIDISNISFESFNSPDIKDFGPNVLSRGMGIIPHMVIDSSRKLMDKKKRGNPYPITEESFYLNSRYAPFYESNCSGSIVINLHIDTVKIIPVIDHITVRLKFGKVYDTKALTNSIRRTISQTLFEVCPCVENNAELDLRVRSNPHFEVGSCTSLIRGITTAAMTTAISQALSCNIKKIPLSETDLMNILTEQGEHHEAELHN